MNALPPRPPPAIADAAAARRPPLVVQVGGVLALLESVLPGGADARALPLWEALSPSLSRGLVVVAAGTACASLAGAAWARARGMRLRAVIHGPLAHEQREVLALWGAAHEQCPGPSAAQERGRELAALGAGFLLPPLDSAAAVVELERSLGRGLAAVLAEQALQCRLLVAPAGARAVLLGVRAALQRPGGGLRCVALVAASPADELPELPVLADLPAGIELLPITRAAARSARARFGARGLSLSHASAAALACAEELTSRGLGGAALALCTQSGEHEFSLEPREPGA